METKHFKVPEWTEDLVKLIIDKNWGSNDRNWEKNQFQIYDDRIRNFFSDTIKLT